MSKKSERDINIVLDELWKDIDKIDYKIDCIFFAGDLVNTGTEEEYELVKTLLINPLLKKTGVPKELFFIVPGNHEVNRVKINKFIDSDLTDKFNDTVSLNEFIDTSCNNTPLFSRLDDYFKFYNQEFDANSNLVNKTLLYSTYMFDHNGFKIGIACLNSAWGAQGGKGDVNKLLIGERQIDNSLNDIKSANIKIAMFHHPLEWLKEFDRESIYTRIITEFDIILNGHMHTPDCKHFSSLNNQSAIFLRCASLFDGRLYNGYSIVKMDLAVREVELNFREYFDKPNRRYGSAERIAANGYAKLSLRTTDDLVIVKKHIYVKQKLKEALQYKISNCLISTDYHKKLDQLFVFPTISEVPEGLIMDFEKSSNDNVHPNDIIIGKDNLLLVGRKEIGKTTILKYICNHYLNSMNNFIPVIINFNDIPKGSNVINKSIYNFFIEYNINDFDLEYLLSNGHIVLLIDDFCLNNKKNIERFMAFSKKYPNVRYILTMNEDLLQSIKIKDIPDLGFKYNTFYLHSFSASQVRQLVKNWFLGIEQQEKIDITMTKVMNIVEKAGLPRNPLIVSLLLWLMEQESSYIPVNEAALIETYVQILLQKLNPDDAKYENFNYKIKEDFLIQLSISFIETKKKYINKDCFEEFYFNYFKRKGLEISDKFKCELFDTGILIRNNSNILFRFRCVGQYFISLGITEDKSLYDKILSEDNYLMFRNEIVYVAGLNQKNQSLSILKTIEERLLKEFIEIDKIIDIDRMKDYPVKDLIYQSLKDNDIKESMKIIKLDDDIKDDIFDLTHKKSSNSEDFPDNTSEIMEENPKNDFFNKSDKYLEVLELYANVLKNCELLDVYLKVNPLKICIEKCCKLIGLLYKKLYTSFVEEFQNQESNCKTKEFFSEKDVSNSKDIEEVAIYILTTGMPISIQHFLFNSVGSPKLKIVIEELLQTELTDFEKFILIGLYGDLRLENHINYFISFLKSTKSTIIQEIIVQKLLYYQAFYVYTKSQQDKISDAIAEYIAKKRGYMIPSFKGRNRKVMEKNMQENFKQNIKKQIHNSMKGDL